MHQHTTGILYSLYQNIQKVFIVTLKTINIIMNWSCFIDDRLVITFDIYSKREDVFLLISESWLWLFIDVQMVHDYMIYCVSITVSPC